MSSKPHSPTSASVRARASAVAVTAMINVLQVIAADNSPKIALTTLGGNRNAVITAGNDLESASNSSTSAIPSPQSSSSSSWGGMHNGLYWFFVGFMGVFGIYARFLLNELILLNSWWSVYFPFMTMFINILGSLCIGFCYAVFSLYSPDNPSEWYAVAGVGLMTGFMGGFTTFSGYALDIVKTFQNALNAVDDDTRKKFWTIGFVDFFLTPPLCLAACLLGVYFGTIWKK